MFNKLFKSQINIHFKEAISQKTSVAIISFHKCATTFLSNHVINNSKIYIPIDYQGYHYKYDGYLKPIINKRGYIYGILRIYDAKHPSYKLTMDLLHNKNMKKIKTLFWVRDPRDILVSMYYSFGFTHGFSENENIKKYQEKRREYIQSQTIDEYVIKEAYIIRKKFDIMYHVMNECDDKLFLKYEDMIHNYEYFYNSLNEFLVLNESMKKEIYKQTRPNTIEDKNIHKRSGKTGGYKEKLQQQTIEELNTILANVLQKFTYNDERV